MHGRVFISGIGVISAIGDDVQENLKSLIEQKSGIGKISVLASAHSNIYPTGEIKYSNERLAEKLKIEPSLNLPRTSLLAMIAAKEAITNANINDIREYRTGIIAGTTVGGMDKTEKYYYNLDQNTDFIKSHSCGNITEQLADYLGIRDFVTTLNTACSSSANAIMFGAKLIRNGMLDRVIAGGFDALSRFTLNGFRSLYILSSEACKPFDKDRNGLNLGEGAGFVVLESEALVSRSGKKPLCCLSGFANANDAFHQTASSNEGNGAFLCMTEAIQRAGLQPDEIDYINVHGTGTENNDLSEASALIRVFGKKVPPFSSTKPYIGHTLGAAGGIEAVYSVLAIREGILFPNLNFKEPIDSLNLIPQQFLKTNVNIRHVMSNSFGFGGNDTSLIFSMN